jgi:hypothetical protein
MENQSNSLAQSIILHVDDDLFFSKVKKSSSSIGQYSERYYFSDKQSVIPFKWEEKPGISKEELGILKKLEPLPSKIVPPIIPTPAEILCLLTTLMKNQSYSPAELIFHVDDDLFFSKVQKSGSSIGQYLGPYYFSDKQSVIPFKWEKEPGIPKELEPLPSNIIQSIIPIPAKLKPKHVTKHVSTKFFFLTSQNVFQPNLVFLLSL